MYFDLFHPYPLPISEALTKSKSKNKSKGKSAALPLQQDDSGPNGESLSEKRPYFSLISANEREGVTRSAALAGHLGYSVIGCTISSEPSLNPPECPFHPSSIPFPTLDPRYRDSPSGPASTPPTPSPSRKGKGRGGQTLVQVKRLHMRLDDGKLHCFSSGKTPILKEYDILSVQPMTDKAFQLACTELSNPGPNQISIITIPLYERPFFYRLNRKQVRQALRNGIMLEIMYSTALFPSSSISPDIARRYRQNFFSNARELVRVTEGKGIIFSSGPGSSTSQGEGMRGPLDIINLATVLGLPANLAKEAVSGNPKLLLLRAQARRTFRGVFGVPKLVPAPDTVKEGEMNGEGESQDVEMNDPAATKQSLVNGNGEERKQGKNAKRPGAADHGSNKRKKQDKS